jgi:hypothetical protein
MATLIKCTNHAGYPVYVNMDQVITIEPDTEGRSIIRAAGEDHEIYVNDSPSIILEKVKFSQSRQSKNRKK